MLQPMRAARKTFIATVRMLMLRRAGRGLTVFCSTLLVSLGALSASATASPPQPPNVSVPSATSPQTSEAIGPGTPGHYAPAPSGEITPMAQSGPITAGSCKYEQAIDDPHISSTAPRAASVHGWWLKDSGTCPSKATVAVYLQAYWCDPFYGCYWRTVSRGRTDVYAGGGSGNRATARLTCSKSSTVGWRGFVDVDLDGVRDPSGYTYSAIRNLACSP